MAAALLCAGAALQGTLVYAQTPGQLLRHSAGTTGGTVRLSGTVQPGSEQRRPDGIAFVLTGGGGSVRVQSRQLPTSSFREGEGAVVEGHLQPDGVFDAERLITKHSNSYRART